MRKRLDDLAADPESQALFDAIDKAGNGFRAVRDDLVLDLLVGGVGNHIPANTPVENCVYYNDAYMGVDECSASGGNGGGEDVDPNEEQEAIEMGLYSASGARNFPGLMFLPLIDK